MKHKRVLMAASVASMIDQFNLPNICLLQDMGYEVHVACNLKEGNTCDTKRIRKFKKQLWSMHVVLHQWDCPRNIRSVKKCFRAYRQLWKLVGSSEFAWIHCHSPVGGVLARLVAHRAGIPVVYTAHGFHFFQGAPVKNWLLYYPVEKLLSYWTDILVTVNKEDYRFARRYLSAGKVYGIPGIGIDIVKFRDGAAGKNIGGSFRKKYRIPLDAVLLLSVGELSTRKNHRTVITALADLVEQGKDVYYMVCGQGALKKSLACLAHKLGVLGRLRMPGFLEDVGKAYSEADIFVFPSYQEGMPVALMEAMAAGMPCVVSDVRGNRELIGCGSLRFMPRRPEQLQKILENLIGDEQLRNRLGVYSREKIRAFDQKLVQDRMKRIYQSMENVIQPEEFTQWQRQK